MHPPKTGRPLRWVAGLSLSLLLVAGLVTWAVTNGGDDAPYVAPHPSLAPPTIDAGDAGVVLERLQVALRHGDAAAAAQLADPDVPTAGAQLRAVADNARAAHIGEIALRYVDELGGVDAEGVWTAAVDAVWRFEGFDRAAARSEVAVRFRADSDGDVHVVGIGGSQLRTPVWLAGPAQVQRTGTTLVVVSATAGRLPFYARLAHRAVPVVHRVLTAWKPRLVVEVPADLAALDRALQAPEGDYAAIAAVTVASDGSSAPGAPVHVFVNPDVFGGLHGEGAQVVMSHEATHVAGDGPRSLAPTWLVEGIADYVALRDVALPLSVTARQIRRQVRQDGLPRALPTSADFGTEAPHLGAVYEGAWLICVTLAHRADERALVRLYHRASVGAELGPLLRSLFGWSQRDLLTAWRSRLADLAGDRRAVS